MDPNHSKSLEDKLKALFTNDLTKDDDYETDLKIYQAFERELDLDPEYSADEMENLEWW